MKYSCCRCCMLFFYTVMAICISFLVMKTLSVYQNFVSVCEGNSSICPADHMPVFTPPVDVDYRISDLKADIVRLNMDKEQLYSQLAKVTYDKNYEIEQLMAKIHQLNENSAKTSQGDCSQQQQQQESEKAELNIKFYQAQSKFTDINRQLSQCQTETNGFRDEISRLKIESQTKDTRYSDLESSTSHARTETYTKNTHELEKLNQTIQSLGAESYQKDTDITNWRIENKNLLQKVSELDGMLHSKGCNCSAIVEAESAKYKTSLSEEQTKCTALVKEQTDALMAEQTRHNEAESQYKKNCEIMIDAQRLELTRAFGQNSNISDALRTDLEEANKKLTTVYTEAALCLLDKADVATKLTTVNEQYETVSKKLEQCDTEKKALETSSAQYKSKSIQDLSDFSTKLVQCEVTALKQREAFESASKSLEEATKKHNECTALNQAYSYTLSHHDNQPCEADACFVKLATAENKAIAAEAEALLCKNDNEALKKMNTFIQYQKENCSAESNVTAETLKQCLANVTSAKDNVELAAMYYKENEALKKQMADSTVEAGYCKLKLEQCQTEHLNNSSKTEQLQKDLIACYAVTGYSGERSEQLQNDIVTCNTSLSYLSTLLRDEQTKLGNCLTNQQLAEHEVERIRTQKLDAEKVAVGVNEKLSLCLKYVGENAVYCYAITKERDELKLKAVVVDAPLQ